MSKNLKLSLAWISTNQVCSKNSSKWKVMPETSIFGLCNLKMKNKPKCKGSVQVSKIWLLMYPCFLNFDTNLWRVKVLTKCNSLLALSLLMWIWASELTHWSDMLFCVVSLPIIYLSKLASGNLVLTEFWIILCTALGLTNHQRSGHWPHLFLNCKIYRRLHTQIGIYD